MPGNPKQRRASAKAAPEVETPEEISRMGDLAGVQISVEQARWVAGKIAQRRAAVEAVRGLPYQGYEPANAFRPPEYR